MVKKIKFYAGKIIVEGIMEEIIEVGGTDSDPIIGMDIISKWHILMNCPNSTFEIANKRNYKISH